MGDWQSKEVSARRWIEDQGFKVHDANIIFNANCANIDLIVYGDRGAVFVQVKSSSKPAQRGFLVADGSPWTREQLDGLEPIFNKKPGHLASFVVLVDADAEQDEFYVVPVPKLEALLREKGVAYAAKPKRDGSVRSVGFRKEVSRDRLKPWRRAARLLGRPVHSPAS